jgi:protein TonB
MALLRNAIGSGLSPGAAGWASSAAVHLAGGLALWMLTGALPAVNPRLPGQIQQVELHAAWYDPADRNRPDDVPLLDAPVLITPTAAHIAEHRFVQDTTAVTQPSPAELALVKRLVALPPPNLRPAVALPTDDESSTDVRPPPLRVRPATPTRTGNKADARIPRSSLDGPRVGTTAETPPQLLQNVPPTYPGPAVLNGWEGNVLLRLHIAVDGRVTDVDLITSSGHHILDVEAIRTVRGWRFVPARRKGRDVAVTVRLPVRFELQAD